MATRNPHERRARDDQREGPLRGHAMDMQSSPGLHFPNGLAIEDLQAMAASARTRGEMATTDRLMRSHAADLNAAQRMAWNVGHHAGRHDLIEELGVRYCAQVRKVHARGMDVLMKFGADEEDVSKNEMDLALDAAVDVLAELLGAHRARFAGD